MVTKKNKPVAALEADNGCAEVSWRGKTRVYTIELHGEAYRDLAKEFAMKVGGTVA